MSNNIHYLGAPDLNFPKTAELMMLRSTGGLDQVHVLSEKIEPISRKLLNQVWCSFKSSPPPYLETPDSNFRKTAQEPMPEKEARKSAAYPLLTAFFRLKP